jgi:small-conductance mechanosensitive channel
VPPLRQDLVTPAVVKTARDIESKNRDARGDNARKEVEISKKELQIEKEKAELEGKEAELAKQEAEIVRETAKDFAEIQQALAKAQQEEKEAAGARERVKIAEGRMRAAEDKAWLAEEEARIANERAAVAEGQLKTKRAEITRKIVQSALVVIVGYLLLFSIVGIINRKVKDLKVKHLLRKNVVYILNVLMFVILAFLWFQNIGSITIFLGVAGAGIALALQEAILCTAGWFLILARRPFDVGDRIEFGGVKGDVIDIRLFQTSMLEIGNWVEGEQSTGRIVNVPNSMVFKKENFNYSRGFEYIWNEIRVVVTFESDWRRGEEIMLAHAGKYCEGMEKIVRRKLSAMTRRYMIFYDKLTPIVYVNIKDSGVDLTLRYLTEARSRRLTQDYLCRKILEDFEKEEKVNFAYTTYRIVK